ncbi:MAG: glycosyltransferase family 2 protein [Patescibacteria group bacterium]
MKTFCIIPAFNEDKTIAKVIAEVKPFIDTIVVVDDGSSDDTYKIVKELSSESSELNSLVVLNHLINRGQGAALQTGNQYAIKEKADIIIHFDADGQFIAKEIRDIIKPILTNQADIVFGSRFLNKKSHIPWLKKNIILPTAKIVNYLFLNVKLTDPQNGFRALTHQAAKKIIIENSGMAHCSEIAAKAFQNNLRIAEIPITVIYHNFGQKFSDGFKIIKELLISRLIN